jgi:hypothetical protein
MSKLIGRLVRALITATLISISLVGNAFADEVKTIVCTISYTYDSKKGTESETTGEHVFTFTTRPDQSINVSIDASCDRVTAFNQSDDKYVIACDWMLGSRLFKELYSINRYSGAYQEIFSRDGSGDFLMHTGKCEEAKRKF